MASPCKKLKCTPKKHLSSNGTQESKITSTPQRCVSKTVSPSVSSISSIETTTGNRTRLFNVPDIESNKGSSDQQEIDCSLHSEQSFISEVSQIATIETQEDYDKFFDNLGKIKFIGKIWNIYKPQFENTLYEQVLREPYNAQGHVAEFLSYLNRKPKHALCRIIQFCIDICGFQNFDVSKHYNFTENAGMSIINLLKNDIMLNKNKLLKNTGRYLLMEHSALANILKIGIYSFIQKLCLIGYDEDIFSNGLFMQHFFNFIKCMSYSNMRCVRDTGVIIAIKTLTALVLLYNKVVNYPPDNTYRGDNSRALRKRELSDAIEYCYMIFMKNSHCHGGKAYMMRVECIHELVIWIKYIPEMFLDGFLAIKYIIRFLKDLSKDVRLATLKICLKLIDNGKSFSFIQTMKTEFAEAVAGRFYDVDYRVTVKAIDVFTTLLERDNTFISAEHYQMLVSLIFDKYYPIGEAACRFLQYYFQAMSEIPGDTLKNIASLIAMKPGKYVTELIVEGCLGCFDELRSWKLYATLLLEKTGEDIEKTEALAKLFSEAVRQTLTGKPTVMRQLSKKAVEIDPNQHQNLANTFSLLNTVLQEFEDVPVVLKNVLKVIPLVNSNVLDGKFSQKCMDLCITIEVLYNNCNEEELLEILAEVLKYFCGVANFGERAKRIVERLAHKQAGELLEDLAQPAPVSATDGCLRVAALYAHFNLNEHFTWEGLFDTWPEDPKTILSLLSCCNWYIIWNLRDLTDMSKKYGVVELDSLISIHMKICYEFLTSYFNMLKTLNGEPLHYEIYKRIYDFYLAHNKSLEHPIKLNKQFERLLLTIDSAEEEKMLVTFLETFVIASNNLSLTDKRVQVNRYVNFIHNGICSIDMLRHVFQYYHIYYDEFSPIIEASIMDISKSDDENIILMLIVHTMVMVYETIISKYPVIDINSEDSKNLKLLVKRFSDLKCFRTPSKPFKKLVYFSLVYALKDTSKYDFLYFLKYFVDHLNQDERKKLMEYFKEAIPADIDKKDAILYFGKTIKTKTSPMNKKRKRVVKKDKVKKPKLSTRTRKLSPSKSVKKALPRTESQVIEEDATASSEDDLTIHDSTSDLEELSSLKIKD